MDDGRMRGLEQVCCPGRWFGGYSAASTCGSDQWKDQQHSHDLPGDLWCDSFQPTDQNGGGDETVDVWVPTARCPVEPLLFLVDALCSFVSFSKLMNKGLFLAPVHFFFLQWPYFKSGRKPIPPGWWGRLLAHHPRSTCDPETTG